MWVAYGVQQADKTGLSTQALFGLREDTGLVGQQYSWCVLSLALMSFPECVVRLSTIFYLAYM